MTDLPKRLHPNTLFVGNQPAYTLALRIDELSRMVSDFNYMGDDLNVQYTEWMLESYVSAWMLVTHSERNDAADWVQGRWDRVK